ncbi:hypothetical protein KFZ70_06180 [Tamlana fucoidanivorans]|uniref:CBM-cenC domain-containing protein n=1 Tax=Allotamlana fucoidanivorans TaxID=2583814 RepID=A0A5C4SMU3_9FLAO|nr:hypothetical protein [Tamlana fucoidanivorans]TNJ45399.1 hypothetical protein FGF67_06730 [Tamlana fucoidanivorans]
MSDIEIDRSARLNGGFEHIQNDLPVNWQMYTPHTVPNSDFNIVIDQENFIEGKKSLKFEVKHCKSTGGWGSPGFTNQFREVGSFKGEASYSIKFWIMNQGTKYRIKAGGVNAFEGHMKVILEDNADIHRWKMFEFIIDVPKDMELRLELNILEPGTFWIDNVQIHKI